MGTLRETAPKPGVVVVGIDFSELSEGALRMAAEMALRGQKVHLHLVHVLSPNERNTTPPAKSGMLPIGEAIRTRLTELGMQIAPMVERMEVHVRTGKPDVEIAELAGDLRADLILVGANNRKGMGRVFGSIADSLMRDAPCPVMTYYSRSIPPWERIEPPCAECVAVRESTKGERLWCEHHSEHHVRPHTYSQLAEGYGLGAQTFR